MAITDFYIKRGDSTESVVIACTKSDGVTPISEDIADATVEFHMMSATGTVLIAHGVGRVQDPTTKQVAYDWALDGSDTATASDAAAPHQAEFQVTLANSRVMTFPNFGNLNIHIYPDIRSEP